MIDGILFHNNLMANKSLQATRDGVSRSAFVDDVIRPACLSFGRWAKPRQ
jgi:hypothetical protein